MKKQKKAPVSPADPTGETTLLPQQPEEPAPAEHTEEPSSGHAEEPIPAQPLCSAADGEPGEPQTEPEPREADDPLLHDIGQGQKSLKGWWIKTVLMLLLVAVSVFVLFQLGGYLSGEDVPQLTFGELLRTINYPYLALLLGVIVFYIAVESGKYAYMLKVETGKFCFRVAVKTMFLGKYYDGITPLSTGGQPFQIYYLHKKKVPSGAASAIPVMRYLVSIVFLSALSVILLSLAPHFVVANTIKPATLKTLVIVSWVSLVINILFPTAVLLFSVFPNGSKKFAIRLINLLARLRLVKNRNHAQIKYVRMIDDYSNTLKEYGKHAFRYIPLYFLCVIECLLLVTIPFFVVIAIADVPPTFELAVQIACLFVISRYTALLIPTPGNTGALEIASSIVFATVVGIESVIGWSVLVWRFVTYYVYILSGIGISIFEIVRSAYRHKKSRSAGQ